MINTQTQIDSLIDLAVLQRTELKQLVDSLPQLRDHLSSEIERNLEEIEPAIRSELEQFVAARALDTQAKTSAELSAKLDAMARNLESTTAAKYSVLMAERAQNATLLAQAEARIAEAASALPGAVKGIVTDELARFPRAGEIDQLRKEFAEPRGLNPRGRWQASETYNKLDLVSYNGDSYVSNTNGNREKPSRSSEAWTLSAARGNGGAGGGVTSLTDLVAVPANGELLIGNGSAFVNSTLTAGTGVTITNGPGTITIDASGAQEVLTATVTNAESFAITRGQVVYLFGATGNRASVKLADNSADATSAKTFGVVSETSIAAGGTGLITCVGVVDKLMLGAYNDGDTLYLGNTPGAVTNVKPYAPNHLVYVGMVERANNGNGELYVKIQNGYELDEIHDVQITTPPLAGSLLMRDATTSLWKANRLTGTANQVTVTNADTSVTLSLPTAIANVNSVTAATTQNLTLAGGSTGASLVLGQGATAANIVLTPKGTGNVGINSASPGQKLQVASDTNIAAAANTAQLGLVSSTDKNEALFLGFDTTTKTGVIQALIVGTAFKPLVLQPGGGNLLIGTTTDIAGSGGLKVAGTTAASSTTSGALQVSGGVGVGGAGYFGGNATVLSGGSSPLLLGALNNGNTGIAWNGSVVTSTANLYSDNNYLVLNSNGANPLYLNFNNTNASATVNFFNGAAVVTKTGAATFAGAVNVALTGTSGTTDTALNLTTTQTAAGSGTKVRFGSTTYAALAEIHGGNVSGGQDGFLDFYVRSGGSAVKQLAIASTGAATFAGAVTVNAISGINALAAGTQLATFESSVNGAAVELITKGKNSTGTARQANIGINRFADDVLSFSNGTTESLRLHLTTQAATFAGTVTGGLITSQANDNSSGFVVKRSSNPYIDFYDGGTSGTIRGEISATNDGVNGGTLVFSPRNAAGSITTAMTLTKDLAAAFAGAVTTGGKLGVGTAVANYAGILNGLSVTANSGLAAVYNSSGAITTAAANDQLYGLRIDNSYSNAGSYANTLGAHLRLHTRAFTGFAVGSGLEIGNITGAAANFAIRSGSGIVSFGDTTPSGGAGSGALQVAGGIYAGAASVFGGTVAISGGIVGTTTNNNAAAGIVGEIVVSTVDSGSGVSLTSAVVANATSITLTAGDWDVTGIVGYDTSGATVSQFLQGTNNASGSLGPTGTLSKVAQSLSGDTNNWYHIVPTYRFSLSGTSTVYLLARATFSAGTVSAFGAIRARRAR